MFVVTVEFEIHPQHVEAFHGAMLAQAEASLTREVACRQFDICRAGDEPQKYFLYERYDDAAAFEAHLSSEHFLQFDQQVQSWVRHKQVHTWEQVSPSASAEN